MKLSPTMQEALDFAKKHGGLWRHPGGYWADEGWNQARGGINFGTTTVHALVTRGVMEYTERRNSHRGPDFPIKAEVVSQ